MEAEWTIACLSDVAEFSSGKSLHKSNYSPNGRWPVMGANGVLGMCESPLYENPVITIGRVGSCGEIHRTTGPSWISDNALVVQCKSGCDFLFLYYYLKSTNFTSITGGTTQPLITQTAVKNLPILMPPLQEQKRIAGILGALDDKIELNRKMNETLEQMAQALFKSWFVDFDPVRAKAAGSKPAGIDKANSDLFPDELVDSQLGTIPRGWRTATLSDCCEKIFSGGTPDRSRKDFWHGNIPWLSSGETRNSFIIKTEECITPAGVDNSSTRLAKRGNTVIASAGQGQTRGQTSLLSGDFYINQSIIALEPKNGEPYELFNYFGMERRYDELRQLSDSNSSRGSLTTKLVAQMPVIIPPKQLLISFDKIVAPIVSAIVNNEAQSESLSSTRDAVLIKLLRK